MFTSYAQNFEDVMLWRALKHVENGVYIDVGAQHPVIDSVSLAFYEHGWRGVHVEPNSHYAQLLRESRPDETVLQAAVSGKGAVLKFFEITDTGLSTCDGEIAERHRASGFTVSETSVPSVTLANVFESCADCEVHWLKIDVEGLEEQVLQGWKPSQARPWIVVVESILPLTQIETHEEWEKLILDLNYQFVYFDGLNRYYLSQIHPELKDAFRACPNVFDDFVLSGTSSAPFCVLLNNRLATSEQELGAQITQGQIELAEARARLHVQSEDLTGSQTRAQWLENEWNAAKAKIDELNHHSHHWWTIADGLNRELQAVYASRSWRLTGPLRDMNVLVKQGKHKFNTGAAMISSIPGRIAQFLLRHALAYVNHHPKIKVSARKLLAHFPLLKARLKAFAQGNARMSMQGVSSYHPISMTQLDAKVATQAESQVDSVSPCSVRADVQQKFHRAVNAWRLGRRVDG